MRSNNEDNFCFNLFCADKEHADLKYKAFIDDKNIRFFGVFDGLGGGEKGEEASYIAAKTLLEIRSVGNYYYTANEKVSSINIAKSSNVSGSTAVIIEISQGYFRCSNIGDSRAYLIRKKNIRQLSVDHTTLQTLISRGVITKEQAEKSNYKNVLSQCLGMNENDVKICPYISEAEPVENGDIFLLCSDGLTKLDDQDINKIILETDKKDICGKLFEAAVRAGSKDNVTFILVYADSVKAESKSIFQKLAQIVNVFKS